MQQSIRQEQEPLAPRYKRSERSSSNKDRLEDLLDDSPQEKVAMAYSNQDDLDDLFRSMRNKRPAEKVEKPRLRTRSDPVNDAGNLVNKARHIAGARSSDRAKPLRSESNKPKLVPFDDDYVDFNEENVDYDLASTLYDNLPTLSMDGLSQVLQDVAKFATVQADNLRDLNSSDVGQAIMQGASIAHEGFSALLEQEDMLKCVTSIGLICYGGSWIHLAAIFAAVEAFGTKGVIEDAMDVCQNFLAAEPDDENDVTPKEIKDTFQKLGLQIALMIAVMSSPSWAEICIAVSFASKLTTLIPIEDVLSKALAAPDMSMTADLEEWFQVVDGEWFSLLSTLACNIFSLTVFGCFPSLVTAMYMGVIGLETLAESVPEVMELYIPLGDMCIPVYGIERSDLFSEDTLHYVWALNLFMALWQAYSGYTGTFQFLSWLMFLLPVVKIVNLCTTGQWEKQKTE